MAKTRIDCLMPSVSQYGVLQHFTQELSQSLQKLGHECRLVEYANIWKTTLTDPPDITIGFNGAPQHPSGAFLSDLIEKPHFCCLMDIAYRYFPLLESPYIEFTCNDQLSCDLLDLKQHKNALFLPPGAPRKNISFSSEPKEFDFVLLTTFIDFESRKKNWRHQFPPSICTLMDQTIERVFSNSQISYIEAFQISFNEFLNQGKLEDEQFDLYAIWEQIELYIRGFERVELVKALSEFPIHIFDSSVDPITWKSYFRDKRPNLIFHPPTTFEESFNILKKSKFVLNSSPHLRSGAHERVFNALACGALPITEANSYMQKIFTDNDLIFYRHPHLDQIKDILATYQNQDRWEEAVISGQKKVQDHHTWDTRAETLINFFKSIKH